MTPDLARLAGGGCSYEVIADQNVWPVGASPLAIMAAQTKAPDNSQIRLTFENATLYPSAGIVRFRVYVDRGRVRKIERQATPGEPDKSR